MKTLVLENIRNIVGGQKNKIPHFLRFYKSEEDFSIDISSENIENWKKLPTLAEDPQRDLFLERNLKSMPQMLILMVNESENTYKIYRVVV